MSGETSSFRDKRSKILSAKGALILHSSVMLLLILPVIAWAVFQGWEQTNALQAQQLRTLMRSVAQREQLLIEGARSFLQALALSDTFHDADTPLSPERTQGLLKQFYLIQNNYFGLFAFLPDGKSLCAFVDAKPYEVPPELIQKRQYFAALHGKGLHIGQPVTLLTGHHVLPISIGALDEHGTPRALLMLPLNINDERAMIQRLFAGVPFPVQYHIALRDHAGKILDIWEPETMDADFSSIQPLLESPPVQYTDAGVAPYQEHAAMWTNANGKTHYGFMVTLPLPHDDALSADQYVAMQIIGVTGAIPFNAFLFSHYRWQLGGMLSVLLLTLLLARYIGSYYFTDGLALLTRATKEGRADIVHGRTAALHGCREVLELGESYDSLICSLQRTTQELYTLSTTDALTGLLNRREFFARACKELLRAQRTGLPVSFAMMDIDHFKKVNDTYGHAAGDTVLHSFAKLVRGSLRENDLAGRYGGEEFVVCLPDTDAQGAMVALEKIRQQWEKTEVAAESGSIICTVSAGIYDVQWEHNTILREEECQNLLHSAIMHADSALYRAKEMGRNRTLGRI